MDHFAGLDVSVKETSICIVDDTGRIVREVRVASEPEALLKVLGNPVYRFKRIGLEAGPLSQWLFSALAGAEFEISDSDAGKMFNVFRCRSTYPGQLLDSFIDLNSSRFRVFSPEERKWYGTGVDTEDRRRAESPVTVGETDPGDDG